MIRDSIHAFLIMFGAMVFSVVAALAISISIAGARETWEALLKAVS
jgi:hypothetical protein